jgi:hypothetical protein
VPIRPNRYRAEEPVRRTGVHVITAVRTDTGWLMRLEVIEAGRSPRRILVRVPADASADAATARIMEAVARGRAATPAAAPEPAPVP